jgi:hypothetical protein
MVILKTIITLIGFAVFMLALYLVYINQITYPLPDTSSIEEDFIVSSGVLSGKCRCRGGAQCDQVQTEYDTIAAQISDGRFGDDTATLLQMLYDAESSAYGRCSASFW